MATRRLVEGTVKSFRDPATPVTISRGVQLINPPMKRDTVVRDGVRVTTGQKVDTPAVRKRLLPNMLVHTRKARRARMNSTPENGFEASVIPTIHPYSWNYENFNRTTYSDTASDLWRVAYVTQDGKFFAAQRVLPATLYRVQQDGEIKPKYRTWIATHPETGRRFTNSGSGPVTEAELERQTASRALLDDEYIRRAGFVILKTSSIDRAYNWDEMPVEFRDHIRGAARKHVRTRLYARLTMNTPGINEYHNSERFQPGHRGNDLRQLFVAAGAEIAKGLKELVKQVRSNGTDTIVLRAAARNIERYYGYTPSDDPTRRKTVNEIIARYFAKHAPDLSVPVKHTGCGHWGVAGSGESLGGAHYCDNCVSTYARTVLNENGETVRVHGGNTSIYDWSDGTQRTYSEPRIINSYHASKRIVGFIPPLVSVGKEYPTLGIELEMQGATSDIRDCKLEVMARQFRDRLKLGPLDPKLHTKYLSFEHDGSVQGGFEAVTGWTDLQTHRSILKPVLVDENGQSPWRGKLISHNASNGCCGLHVHISKPKSLLHGAKLKYMMNASAFEPIITALARRYNTNYARVRGGDTAQHMAVEKLKEVKQGMSQFRVARHYDYRRDQYVETPGKKLEGVAKVTAMRQAIEQSLAHFSGERYEIANFTNAATVEIRAFRGTMMFPTVMACMEFVQAAWYFAREVAATSVTPENFLKFINEPARGRDTAELRKYLAGKGFKVRLPNPNKKSAPLVAESGGDSERAAEPTTEPASPAVTQAARAVEDITQAADRIREMQEARQVAIRAVQQERERERQAIRMRGRTDTRIDHELVEARGRAQAYWRDNRHPSRVSVVMRRGSYEREGTIYEFEFNQHGDVLRHRRGSDDWVVNRTMSRTPPPAARWVPVSAYFDEAVDFDSQMLRNEPLTSMSGISRWTMDDLARSTGVIANAPTTGRRLNVGTQLGESLTAILERYAPLREALRNNPEETVTDRLNQMDSDDDLTF